MLLHTQTSDISCCCQFFWSDYLRPICHATRAIFYYFLYYLQANSILFVDASREFTPGKNQNTLEEEHIDKIVKAYTTRTEVDGYAHVANLDEIIKNDWNLNIPRYVDSGIEQEVIDLDFIQESIQSRTEAAKRMEDRLTAYFKELGI